MDRQILYPAQIPLVEDGLNAQRNAMVGIGHLAGAAFGSATVAASGFACEPGDGLSLVIAPGAILAPGVVDASAYGTLSAVSSALVRQFISRDPVTLAVPAADATYIVYVSPQTVDTDDTVLPFYNAVDPSVTYAGQNNSGLTAPTVRRDEAVLGIAADPPDGSHPLWLVTVPAGATAITADMVSVASGAPFYPSLAAVAPRIVAPFNAQLAAAMGGYPLNAVVADTATPGTFWVSTADANVSVPGATGATWQSLFNGYATQDWANGQFLQLAAKALQTVTGPVTFSGITTVPTPTDYTQKQAIGASDADKRYGGLAAPNTWREPQIFRGNVITAGTAHFETYDQAGGEASTVFGAYDPGTGNDNVEAFFNIINSTRTQIQQITFNGAGGISTSSRGAVAFTSELPAAGTITGGTYTKTPMNDGTGRSVLRQSFKITHALNGNTITYPISFSSLPIVSVIPSAEYSSSTSGTYSGLGTVTYVEPNTETINGFVAHIDTLGGSGTYASGYGTDLFIVAEGIVS